MTQVCCFVQRQDGHVAGLVDRDSEGKIDLSTARLVIGNSKDDEDEGDAAIRIFEEIVLMYLSPSFCLQIWTHVTNMIA